MMVKMMMMMMVMMMTMMTSCDEVAGLQAAPRLRDGEIARRSIVPAPSPLKMLSLTLAA